MTSDLLEARLERSVANPKPAPKQLRACDVDGSMLVKAMHDPNPQAMCVNMAGAMGVMVSQLRSAQETLEQLNKEPLSREAHTRVTMRIASIERAVCGLVQG